ncbi:hypothetical protein DFP72DRAFT_1067424 [Ephemerocybe angulata]|uniref:Uncharacterized protein n=1 Tax=Ephemerocybe angulata TaxID=980116 RepID=A0A8H6I0C4_9AGAR|nr:hypothetical protein DFP72DRAFT_1067424 [Tulosesus angulatus]
MAARTAVTQSEYVARRLLANSATGAISALKALAQEYPYQSSDFRPFEAVISFIRDLPPPQPTQSSHSAAMVQALACLGVVERVGVALNPGHPCFEAFLVMMKGEWPFMLAWLTFSLEHSVNFVLTEHIAVPPILTIARFLAKYSPPPAFASPVGGWDATVDLAFRIWSRNVHETKQLEEVTEAMLSFWGKCLDVEGEAKNTVLDHFQEPTTAQSFFKSYAALLMVRSQDTSPQGVLYTFQLQGFYMRLLRHLSRLPNWRNIWRWTIKKGIFKAYTASIFILLSGPVYVDRSMLAGLGNLILLAEKDAEGILSKIVRISLEDLAPLLYECLHTPERDTRNYAARLLLSSDQDARAAQQAIFQHLRRLEAYLPYPCVSRAVAISLQRHFANRPQLPSHMLVKEWSLFRSALTFSALSHTKEEEYYLFACDNLNRSGLRTAVLHQAKIQCLGGHALIAERFSTAPHSAKGRIGILSIDMSALVLLICDRVSGSNYF